MPTKYNWTTGPVRSSLGYDSTLIVVSNNSMKTQKVEVDFFDLGYTPKKKLLSKTMTLGAEMTKSIDTQRPQAASWEVQIHANSKNLSAWIGGRRLNYNLPGNTVLQTELQTY